MDEHKYRIWDTTNNNWLEDHITDSFILYDIKKPSKELIASQYIGLDDKNGIEIYDGDYINYGLFAFNDSAKYGDKPWNNLPDGVDENDISTVIGTYKVKFPDDYNVIKNLINNNQDVEGVEIIGNIYQHPGLLKADNG